MTNYVQEFRSAWRQRQENAPPRGAIPTTDADERRFHLSMAKLCEARGLTALAESHRVHAGDCPAGCDCPGCELTRAEAAEAKERRVKRGMQRQSQARGARETVD